MDINTKLKQTAINRWNKVHAVQLEHIRNSPNLNYLKARILGFLAGDGNIYVKDTHFYARFYLDHPSLIEALSYAFRQVYRTEPIVKPLVNHFLLIVYSKVIIEDLLSYGKVGTYNWHLPSNLIDNQSKTEWLKAFFDAEATVQKMYIRVGSVNGPGLAQVQALLTEFNINSKIYEYIPKNPKWSKNYLLDIRNKENKLKYFNQIGFNHEIKRQKLANQLSIAEVA